MLVAFLGDIPLPSLEFVDGCDADNCFTVIDSYSSPEPNGFTVWDTTCPGNILLILCFVFRQDRERDLMPTANCPG